MDWAGVVRCGGVDGLGNEDWDERNEWEFSCAVGEMHRHASSLLLHFPCTPPHPHSHSLITSLSLTRYHSPPSPLSPNL